MGMLLGAWLAAPVAQAAYDPPAMLTIAAPATAAAAPDGPAAAEARLALIAALPPGARLLLGPLPLPFGAHAQGWFVALRSAEGGYALWYATPQPGAPGLWRLLRLRDPQPADEFIDVQVHEAFAAGPEGSHDIVVRETFSRPAPAGGAAQTGATVYRRSGDGAQPVPALTALLDGVRSADQALQRLAPAYARLLPPVRGALAQAFVTLPLEVVDLTRLERLQRLQPGDPLHAVFDPPNGYLLTRGDAGLPAYVLAQFRHADGGMLLAVQRRWPQAQQTWLLQGSPAQGWQEVSAQVLPGFVPEADYALPRQGRRLALPDGRAWDWDGRRFVPAALPVDGRRRPGPSQAPSARPASGGAAAVRQ